MPTKIPNLFYLSTYSKEFYLDYSFLSAVGVAFRRTNGATEGQTALRSERTPKRDKTVFK